MNKRTVGTEKEKLAAEYLVGKGYRILDMNYRCKTGEIDIIASHEDTIVFAEVKYRAGKRYGTAVEAVSAAKQKTIRQVAMYYLVTRLHKSNVGCRFDVIGIDRDEITHIINAF